MTNIDERLDQLDQGLISVNEQLAEVNSRLDKHDERFNQIDERFNQVDDRFATTDKKIDSLASDVGKLRVLEEANSQNIRLIAEVQAHHGTVLEQIVKDIEPLKHQAAVMERLAQDVAPLKDFVTRAVDEHERRITALERRRANGS